MCVDYKMNHVSLSQVVDPNLCLYPETTSTLHCQCLCYFPMKSTTMQLTHLTQNPSHLEGQQSHLMYIDESVTKRHWNCPPLQKASNEVIVFLSQEDAE